MYDLHCHLLPSLDDGAPDLKVSLDMARLAVADGISVVACTPHILPGVYPNTGADIRAAVARLQGALDDAGIALKLTTGADAHMCPDFLSRLASGHILSLADSRYVLVEPPHHVAPPRIEEFFFQLIVAGYVPILTHPERLSWLPSHYDTVVRLAQSGVWIQITAGSLAGAFGRNARYWSERMLDGGYVHILATDAHDTQRRPPTLSIGRELAAKRLGERAAEDLVMTRPRGVLDNADPTRLPLPGGARPLPDGATEARDGGPDEKSAGEAAAYPQVSDDGRRHGGARRLWGLLR